MSAAAVDDPTAGPSGDGIVDVVTVNTVGAPVVRAFDGVTGASLGSFPVPGAAAGARYPEAGMASLDSER